MLLSIFTIRMTSMPFAECGCELVEIDTLHDQKLPDDIDGLFIGGGFPETQMEQLAANSRVACRDT